jgi:hypothetical protein
MSKLIAARDAAEAALQRFNDLIFEAGCCDLHGGFTLTACGMNAEQAKKLLLELTPNTNRKN